VALTSVIPGLGQVADGGTVKGSGIWGAFAASALGTYVADSRFGERLETYHLEQVAYEEASLSNVVEQREAMETAYDETVSARRLRRSLIGLTAAIYTYAVADAILNHMPRRRALRPVAATSTTTTYLRVTPSQDGIGIALKF
jgi:hypothetical protein